MVDGWSGGFGRPQTPEEKIVFENWLQSAQSARPDELIECFRRMYLDPGGVYPNGEVRDAMHTILATDACVQDFRYVLNRTCFILINTWSAQPWHYEAIPCLVKQFEQLPDEPSQSSSDAVRLHELAYDFLRTPEYEALQKIAQVWEQRLHPSAINGNTLVEDLVYRYPFAYHQMFFGMANAQGNDPIPRQVIHSMQTGAQRTFRSELSQYIAHRRTGRPAVNPTLLEDTMLDAALRQFRGKVHGNRTQRDLASHFRTSCQWVHSYREFKRNLYYYLKDGLPTYGDGRFLSRLNQRIDQTQGHHDGATLDGSLIDDTCRDLLYFLVLDRSGYDHFTFLDLVTNIGAVATIGLLMKIVLLCKQAKFWVEQRFTGLFKHYTNYSVADASWLIESLETLKVGLTVSSFGSSVAAA